MSRPGKSPCFLGSMFRRILLKWNRVLISSTVSRPVNRRCTWLAGLCCREMRSEASDSGPSGLHNDRAPQSPCPHLEERKDTLQERGGQSSERGAFTLHLTTAAWTYASHGEGTGLGEPSRGRLDLGRGRSGHRRWARGRDRYTKSRREVGPASPCLAHSRRHSRRHPALVNPEGPELAHLQPGHQ